MPFPPGDMIAAFGRYLHFQRLEQILIERHPELAHLVDRPAAEQSYLEVKLSSEKSAMLMLTKFRHSFAWAVVDPVLHTRPSVWPLDTPVEVLVDALHAYASAYLTGSPVPSPWRWQESELSEITELADHLDGRGVHVQRVVGQNRYRADGPFHETRLAIADRSAGAYAEVAFPDAEVRVSLKPHLGWIFDTYDPKREVWSRVDIGWSLGHGTSPRPGGSLQDFPVSAVADLLSAGRKAWQMHEVWETPEVSQTRHASQEALFTLATPRSMPLDELFDGSTPQRPMRTSPRDIVESVLGQLATFGFGDVSEGDNNTPIHSDHFHIEWRNQAKDLSTPQVKMLNGVAAAASEDVLKRLIVITSGGISRPASAFADQAKAFIFHLDRRTGRLGAHNMRAQEVLLPRRTPGNGP
ncbi:hypothetical protein AB0H17_07040 [Streptomyces olivoreticuli]|uniref:Uncharacterized protein n=1 Tax=Kitasatospora mediocidica TaxID=58352 RepID=A0A2S0X9Z0_9ACTN|nr:hypothetical protein [Kitasatospora mediocidica]